MGMEDKEKKLVRREIEEGESEYKRESKGDSEENYYENLDEKSLIAAYSREQEGHVRKGEIRRMKLMAKIMKERAIPVPSNLPVDPEKLKIKYQLMFNSAAGDYYVNEWTQAEIENWEEAGYRSQEGHYNDVGTYDSREKLNEAIEKLAGEPVFAVFADDPAGEVYYSQEDRLTGNWRGNREGHARCIAEFKNEQDAKAHVRKVRKYYDSL